MWNVFIEGMRDAWRDWCEMLTTPHIIIPAVVVSIIASVIATYMGL